MIESFRPNAGSIVFNYARKVLVCERIDIRNAWQFPQGGIEENETPAEAAIRELYEETSLSLNDVTLIKTLDAPIRYHFPHDIVLKMQKRGFDNSGQDIFWSLFFMHGNESAINLQTQYPEFKSFRWVDISEACDLIVDFKKNAYQVAKNNFESLIINFPI